MRTAGRFPSDAIKGPQAGVEGRVALTGFSHGAAGIAWALLELSHVTGDQRFRTAALEAIRYERGCFNPSVGNWEEFSKFGGKTSGAERAKEVAWCHGAPGIGMARLAALRTLDDAEVRTEIDIALNTTLSNGFGHNHSLCHGDLGNLELLLQARNRLGVFRWNDEAGVRTAILDGIEQDECICGTPWGVESPGLMTGLAGIGYQLLRLAEPQFVPPILLLGPPSP
jgi:lantibiotic modifying enzyme